ncbi:aspartyl/glutamyl-tRNA(Asn/Gln) amidotransferase subunit C [Caminicella sporogenes DSM 14501]|uniref:Aspartyl/glutamyl-tRNA(Asn/Gln) amidotransferase subunit C n=1 Tax=Caminicella sporogenes DSM 14501 TaxID=1121266 RepID=A0A1M6T063_9FIRM|nr:Asp-tRNA(Asn)/Glu-tRNA(Gln) amidotransferase subunit GatC [Caminicella sporogenes]RKD26382.1 asparaginyl/glutamyl-tRNA amidotransferase subunit C [Caminicella sporogenes]SHK50334.1 aspartyl/glutamyl-tRNA(Asn/Gln) amidotransferase subunit C [Caminicella sporogenes DSM 14501]
MSISKQDIKYVANLAKLELSESDIDDFVDEFNSLLKYVEKIKELDVQNIEPTYYVHSIKNVFREDTERCSYDRADILANAPDKIDGYIKIKN